MKRFFIRMSLQDMGVDEFEEALKVVAKSEQDVTVYRVPAQTGNHSLVKIIWKLPNGERFEYQALHRLTGDGYVAFVDANFSGFAVDDRSVRENAGAGPVGFFGSSYPIKFHFNA